MEHYAGIDVSLNLSSVCIIDGKGAIVREAKVTSAPDALVDFLAGLDLCARRSDSRASERRVVRALAGGKSGHFESACFRTWIERGGEDVGLGELRSDSAVCVHLEAQPTGGGAGIRVEPGYDCEDVPLFGASRLCADEAAGTTQAGPAGPGD